MNSCVDVLQQFIVGRADAHAVQQLNGSYLAVRRPLTSKLLQEHVAGHKTLGTYLVTPDGNARCGIYDFDEKNDETRQAILWLWRWFQHWGIEMCIESSGSKGYHGWIITKRVTPAFKIINLLQLAWNQLIEEMGTSMIVEVFPKQATVKDLGNLIKLPWGIHRKTGKRTIFLDTQFRPLPDWGLRLIQELPMIEETVIDEIINEYPKDDEQYTPSRDRVGNTQDEVVGMLSHPLKVGERRPTLVRLAGYLSYRGIPEEVAVALLLPWAERQFSNHLPTGEVERHIRGIYGRYGVREYKIDRVFHGDALATILPKFMSKKRSNGKKKENNSSGRPGRP